jgi:hypothetical protein
MDHHPKAIKLLEESIGVSLCDLRLGNGFLGLTQGTHMTKEKQVSMISAKLKTLMLPGTQLKKFSFLKSFKIGKQMKSINLIRDITLK